ncbi:MAG: GNAT family N-acetyltransferase [Candidatus Paceibacterota bacterium]|jgi:RimJ/RimL family protein N-acetyltransferase
MRTFIGERVYVRPMSETDATSVYAAWLNDSEVNKYLATKSTTVEELKRYIATKNGQSDTLLFGMFLKEDNRHIGTIKLEPIDIANKRATIAIMLGDKREWGKGYGPESMRLLITHCFNELGLEEVNLGVLAQNVSAIKSYEKIGFKEVKREAGAITYPNGIFDQVTMTLHTDSYVS